MDNIMRHLLRMTAAAAAVSISAVSIAAAGEWAGWGSPNVIYAQPNTVIIVPPVGYVPPSYRQMFIVNQGPVYDGPAIMLPRPGYLPGGYDDGPQPAYPFVRSYGSYGEPAVRPFAPRYHWRHRGTYAPFHHRWSGYRFGRAPVMHRAWRDRAMERSFVRPFATYRHYHRFRGSDLYRPHPPYASLPPARAFQPRLHRAPASRFGVSPKPVWPRYRGRAPQRWTHLN